MKSPLVIIGGVLVLAVLVFGTLVATGTIKLSPARPVARIKPPGPTERDAPVSFKELPAGTQITPEMLINPKTQRLMTAREDVKKYLDKHEPIPYFVDAGLVIGRVLRTDKHPGHLFKESDFFPRGTGGGMTSLIPEGYRGVTFSDLKHLDGCRSLKFGDHIDLLASQKLEVGRNPNGEGNHKSLADLYSFKATIGLVGVVARDAVVVSPTGTVPTVTGNSASGKPKIKLVEQMVIAVKVEDVPAVISLIAGGSDLWCLPHSSLPEKDAAPLEVASFDPNANSSDPHAVELIKGSHKTTTFMRPDATQPSEAPGFLTPVPLMNRPRWQPPAPSTAPAATPAAPGAAPAAPTAAPTTAPAKPTLDL